MNDSAKPPANTLEQPPIEKIIGRIDEKLRALGLSDREASIRATGYPDAIREIRRLKYPGGKRLIQLAKALDSTPDYIGGWVDHERGAVWLQTTQSALPRDGVQELPRDIPVFGIALDADLSHTSYDGTAVPVEQIMFDFSRPIDFARRPPRLQGREDVYALIVVGRSMFPRFREGDVLYVDPRAFPREGEDVVIRFKKEKEKTRRQVMIKEYAGNLPPRPSDDDFAWFDQFRQYTPPAVFHISRYDIEQHRVIPQGELLSL
jgi:hypothetical protein